jgi:hypothetical protein
MTPRSLFNIILKILGIFFIKDFLVALPELLSTVSFIFIADSVGEKIISSLTILLIISMYGAIGYFLIFKTGLIIDKLKLDKGFNEENIPLNIHRSTILSISIIVIGGYLAISEIPNFLRQLYFYFQQKRMSYIQPNQSAQYIIVSASKIVIGYLLMREQRWIVNFIESKRKQ